jgi:4-oxalocrotonate tautomerase
MPITSARSNTTDHRQGTNTMPHVIVKAWPGKTGQQKQALADRITADVMDVLGYGEASVSVAFEEVSPRDWAAEVYRQDIQQGRGKLYKKPGYTM